MNDIEIEMAALRSIVNSTYGNSSDISDNHVAFEAYNKLKCVYIRNKKRIKRIFYNG